MKQHSLRITEPGLSETERKNKRQKILQDSLGEKFVTLFDQSNVLPESVGLKNCENWVGGITLPLGVAGPVSFEWSKVSELGCGSWKTKSTYLPLATTEGALIASVNRGCKVLNQSLQTKVFVENNGMTRAPVFSCQDVQTAFALRAYVTVQFSSLKDIANQTSNHAQLLDFQCWIRGRQLYLRLAFDTDKAMGMNMVTIATQAIATELESKVEGVKLLSLSSNVCSDKNDNLINTILGRGYSVTVEAILPHEAISQVLKTNLKKLSTVHFHKNIVGSSLAGSFSQNAHTANTVAAIFVATGQDPAHVVEGSKSFLALEEAEGGLLTTLTLPNLNVGTLGGGTYLPAQTEARLLMEIDDKTKDSAYELAASIGVAALAGELSLLASLSENTLACAHQSLARGK